MTKIRYVYNSFTLGCGCCSDSESYIEFHNEGEPCKEIQCYSLLSNEDELKEYMKEYHPDILEYEVEDDCEWF